VYQKFAGALPPLPFQEDGSRPAVLADIKINSTYAAAFGDNQNAEQRCGSAAACAAQCASGFPGFILDVVGKAGLPAPIAYLVYIGEVVAPVLLIIGLFTRVAALIVVVNMLFALALVHASQLFTLNQQGGWQLELQGMYLFTAVAIALMGAGRLSVGGLAGRWN
jgi:putative oxidoreductase